ncbi:amino acid permease [Pseudoflavonifractor phocaeensis]|uniref:APC family permease n=1 Tax=Pseudoflavonifractor phocaeensis TaxID=1870988 RepID=UPI00313B519B
MKKSRETSAPSLKRCFGLWETITINVGTVIGVGLFTLGANVVGLLGPWVFLATLLALGISIYPSLLYAEMGGALPYAGGTYQYASLGLGRPFGVLAGWNFIISMVSVASGEALAFAFYLRTLFQALGIPLPIGDRAVACLGLAGFLLLALRGVEWSGRLQNGFLFFFWGVALVWVCSMAPRLQFSYFAAGPGVTPQGFLPCVALVWWCFAGFETCCAMGEEIKHPQINLPRALFLAPFLVFAVNGLFQWVLVCIVPPEGLPALAGAAAPYAKGMELAGVAGFPLILLCLGIAFGGDFSTLNASVSAPARYLFTMARDGVLPAAFAKVHPKYHTPYVSILALGALMLLLVSTGSIDHIASLSLFATLLYYVIGIAAALGLRRRRPDLPRPYRAPLIRLGAPVSIAVYLLMMTQLEPSGAAMGAAWCVLGLAVCRPGRRSAGPAGSFPPPPLPPSLDEKAAMDREYRFWRAAVGIAVALVLALYAVAFLLSKG